MTPEMAPHKFNRIVLGALSRQAFDRNLTFGGHQKTQIFGIREAVQNASALDTDILAVQTKNPATDSDQAEIPSGEIAGRSSLSPEEYLPVSPVRHLALATRPSIAPLRI